MRRFKSRLNTYGRQFCGRSCYTVWDKRHKGTDEMRAKMVDRITSGSFKVVSGLEDRVATWLTEHGVSFDRQVKVRPFYLIDFVVGETWIEVNGCYWHGCPIHFPEPTVHQAKRRTRDKALETFCHNRTIPLIALWECAFQAGDCSVLMPLLAGDAAQPAGTK